MTCPFIVGVTGGIASGKSTVAEGFAALGVPIIDTDVLAREVVALNTPALEAITKQFGPSILQADGQLNRAALRDIIFSDEAARTTIESITHPAILQRMLAEIASVHAPYVLVLVPLLIEQGWDSLVDRILVVDVPEHIQVKRLIERDQLSAEQAEAMINSQTDRLTRLGKADDVIDNQDTLDQLAAVISSLHTHYLTLASV